MLTITDSAREKIAELCDADGRPGLVLRVAVRGRGFGGFQYDLQFVEESERAEDDLVLDTGTSKTYVDARSAPSLQGAVLDYVEGVQESGFRFDNPNPLWTDDTALAVQNVIDNQINPAIAAHGGYVLLLDVKDDTVYLQMGGGCQGCGMANVTLKQGVEVMIREAVPKIANVVDTTDHAAGSNPYYQPSKGGG